MKPILLLPLVIALPAFAGTPAPVAPAPEPCLMSWFAGASVGYLTELEEPMYNVHVGVTNSCWMLGGWNVAAFAEVGYANTEWSYIDLDENQDGPYADIGKIDFTIVPVTANVKFERALSGNLNAYIGAGVGMAWVKAKDSGIRDYEDRYADDESYSDSSTDWVLTTQIFAGLSYNVTPACAIYGGARWIYLADADLFGDTQDLDDDWLLELGARYKF